MMESSVLNAEPVELLASRADGPPEHHRHRAAATSSPGGCRRTRTADDSYTLMRFAFVRPARPLLTCMASLCGLTDDATLPLLSLAAVLDDPGACRALGSSILICTEE